MSTTDEKTEVATPSPVAVPAVRRPALAAAGGAMTLLLLVLAPRHGYYLDELYFRVAGRHLDWGYEDQPPLVAVLAAAQTALFGDTVTALRVVPALLAGIGVVVAGLIAREMGGGGAAQLLAAAAAGGAMSSLAAGHTLHPTAVDHLVWLTVCWLLIRLVRTGDSRLWLAIGAVTGIGMQAKNLVVLLVLGLLGGLLLTRGRELLRDRFVVFGAVVGLAIAAPALLWQATHGWPQFTVAGELSGAPDVNTAISFLIGQFLFGGLLLAPVWIGGLVALLRRPDWRPYRAIGLAYLLIVVALLALGGFPRYNEGILVALVAIGAVPAVRWARSRLRQTVLVVAVVANAAVNALVVLPILPVQSYLDNPVLAGLGGEVQTGQTGAKELADQVAAVYRDLSEADQRKAVVYGHDYSQAGAVDRYGAGLPRAYSGNNSYAGFGVPEDDKTLVIAVGVDRAAFERLFSSCEVRGKLTFALPNINQDKEVLVCGGPRQPWSSIWPKLHWTGTF
ncbi:glycosyltransferase family 39 protein [Lentzea sp. NPDC003310]|uniref:ArnT family glycosyltransferase n=1 Tax=Lentzea sp. NPDC003310 TaxID=3154447 RepID=UPI0033B427F7